MKTPTFQQRFKSMPWELKLIATMVAGFVVFEFFWMATRPPRDQSNLTLSQRMQLDSGLTIDHASLAQTLSLHSTRSHTNLVEPDRVILRTVTSATPHAGQPNQAVTQAPAHRAAQPTTQINAMDDTRHRLTGGSANSNTGHEIAALTEPVADRSTLPVIRIPGRFRVANSQSHAAADPLTSESTAASTTTKTFDQWEASQHPLTDASSDPDPSLDNEGESTNSYVQDTRDEVLEGLTGYGSSRVAKLPVAAVGSELLGPESSFVLPLDDAAKGAADASNEADLALPLNLNADHSVTHDDMELIPDDELPMLPTSTEKSSTENIHLPTIVHVDDEPTENGWANDLSDSSLGESSEIEDGEADKGHQDADQPAPQLEGMIENPFATK